MLELEDVRSGYGKLEILHPDAEWLEPGQETKYKQ